MKPSTPFRRLSCLALCLGSAFATAPVLADALNVYTIRHHDSHDALYDAFSERTGIDVNVQEIEFERLLEHAEGRNRINDADLAVIVDAVRLHQATEKGLFDRTSSATLNERLPESVRHPQGEWFGFGQRTRVVFYDPRDVQADEIREYADLADPRFEGQICVRSSSNTYNQALLASIVAHEGEEAAEAWAQGIVNNMARAPEGGDRDQISAVADGTCNIAIANHYYHVRMMKGGDAEQRAAAEQVAIAFPEQGEGQRGAHMNVVGMGVMAGAPHRDNAVRFMEFMTTAPAQQLFVQDSYDYPVVAGVAPADAVTALGTFKKDTLVASELGEHLQTANEIFERVGWQ
ncbi:extracellular solute-binding protein [Kushneria konosiri]|uniref:extracellular solute-binding protein n=1 Tax=Kushneria konosiri TaxID=698828 RepID=UPI001D1310B0|nr:extracellular solute-binding protein [Kushneria konosiri]